MKEVTPTSLQRIKSKKQSSPIQSPTEDFKRKWWVYIYVYII